MRFSRLSSLWSITDFSTSTILSLALLLMAHSANGASEKSISTPDGIIPGFVVSILDGHDHTVVAVHVRFGIDSSQFQAFRSISSSDPLPQPDSVFQVGSVTKIFTGLLLAIGVENGKFQLEDPAEKWLPPELALPKRGTNAISLEELSTHTSGLPRLPPNFSSLMASPLVPVVDPYSTLNRAVISQGLKMCRVKDVKSPPYLYSNLGTGLLGHALCEQSDLDYEALLARDVTGPLGMPDTVISLSDVQRSRFIAGHNSLGEEVSPWKFGMLEGAGALYSTTEDLHKFLAAEMGREITPLLPAMKLSQVPRKSIGPESETQVGLGWHISHVGEHRFWWHTGATFGHTSFIAFCQDLDISVVVLCNEGINPMTGQCLADRIGYPLIQKLLGEPSSRDSAKTAD